MQAATQLAVFIENRPGALARLCEELARIKVNIFALSTSDTVDHVVVRLVVSDSSRALRSLEERGALVVASEVLMIEGDNRPGSLARIAGRLAEAKINIDYAYCATGPSTRKGLLILRATPLEKAMKALNLE